VNNSLNGGRSKGKRKDGHGAGISTGLPGKSVSAIRLAVFSLTAQPRHITRGFPVSPAQQNGIPATIFHSIRS
jgi:hypothetical protein